MRARHRPCSAPLRQAGGIPAAAEPGHPRRGNTPCFHAWPSPTGRGHPGPGPSAAPRQRASGRCSGTSSVSRGKGRGEGGGKQRTLHRSNRPEPGHAEGEPGRPVCLGATFWEGGEPGRRPSPAADYGFPPPESRGGRRGGGARDGRAMGGRCVGASWSPRAGGPRGPVLHPLRRGSRAGARPHDNGTRRRYKYPPASIFGLAGSQTGGPKIAPRARPPRRRCRRSMDSGSAPSPARSRSPCTGPGG